MELPAQVAVIGGGNVALDAARTARRLGAEVTVLYRRSQAEMPADPEETQQAMDEGVRFLFLRAPREIQGKNGRVQAVRTEIVHPAASRRYAGANPSAQGNLRPWRPAA